MNAFSQVSELPTTIAAIESCSYPILEPLCKHLPDLRRKLFDKTRLPRKAIRVIEHVSEDDPEDRVYTTRKLRFGDVANSAVRLAKAYKELLPEAFDDSTKKVASFCVKSIDVTAAINRVCGIGISEREAITACTKVIEVCIRTDPGISMAPVSLRKKDAGEIIRTVSKQLLHFLFDTDLAIKRGWFKEVSQCEDLTSKPKFLKVECFEGEKITKVDKTEMEYIDCRSHYMLTIRKNNDVETDRKIHAVLDSGAVVGDFFSLDFAWDVLGCRKFLILYHLSETICQNNETQCESIGSQFGHQVFSNQGENVAEYRGCIAANSDLFDTMKPICKKLAKLSFEGRSEWGIKKVCLPVTIVNTDRKLERTHAKGTRNPHVYDCLEKDFDKRAILVSTNFLNSN